MNILIVNDDGIFSEGILALANILKKNNNITLVAPDGNRSGFAHSISFYKDIFCKTVELSKDFDAYAISGTPADCVKFGVFSLNRNYDLVVAGINAGSNLGTDVLYSGTVNAGFEANSLGLPSIAFSNIAHGDCNFVETAAIIEKIIDKLLACVDKNYTLNVNVPNLNRNKIKGIKVVKMGPQEYSDRYALMENGAYQLVGSPLIPTAENSDDLDTDVYFAYHGYVTVTPIVSAKTDFDKLNKIKDIKF